MLVVGAAVDIENTAERFNVMLKAQLIDSIQSFSECGVKMAIAFLVLSSPLPVVPYASAFL